MSPKSSMRHEAGTTLLEVLITIVILAFGLLGLAGLQMKIQLAEVESYQRAEALVLLRDMVERMQNYNPTVAYATTGSLGTGDAPGNCAAMAAGVARDQCEWSTALQGAAEAKAGVNVGAMTNAHGCITQLQAPVVQTCASGNTANIPGIYLITVTWTGLHPTVTPSNKCGEADSNYLRSVSTRVSLGVPSCS